MQRHPNSPPAAAEQASPTERSGDGARPKVTAVIPAFNMERFVERALLSALEQSYPHLEILVVDDGSTDGTADIVRRIAAEHRQIRLISCANAGVAAARNLGTERADSLYVAYLDADDVWHPLKIERQVAALAAHGHSAEWGSCYTLYRLIDAEDRVLDNGASSRERGDFFDEHLVWNPVGNGSNLLVRRDLALAVGGFNPEYARAGIGGCEDLELQLQLLRRGKMEVVREYLLGYRVHRAQMSGDSMRMRRSQIAVIRSIVAQADPPARTRKRALIQAYLTAAKGAFLVREWRHAASWVLASVTLSPLESARKMAVLCRQELGYWSLRLRVALADAEPPASLRRRFADFDPLEGVDVLKPAALRYRSTLAGWAQRRSDARRTPTGTGRGD